MGKDNKNREIGKGLSQRLDGRYSARFTTKSGKRIEKYFDSLPQARNWLEDAKHDDKHKTMLPSFDLMAEDASLQTTMDTYVHVTDDSKLLAVKLFEQNDPEAQNGELKDHKKIGVKSSEKMA